MRKRSLVSTALAAVGNRAEQARRDHAVERRVAERQAPHVRAREPCGGAAGPASGRTLEAGVGRRRVEGEVATDPGRPAGAAAP